MRVLNETFVLLHSCDINSSKDECGVDHVYVDITLPLPALRSYLFVFVYLFNRFVNDTMTDIGHDDRLVFWINRLYIGNNELRRT